MPDDNRVFFLQNHCIHDNGNNLISGRTENTYCSKKAYSVYIMDKIFGKNCFFAYCDI